MTSSCYPLPALCKKLAVCRCFFFFQAEDGIRDGHVTGVQTCALPISRRVRRTVREERDRVAAPQGARAMVSAAMRSAGPGDAESAAGYAAAAADVDTDERGEYFHYRLAKIGRASCRDIVVCAMGADRT